MKIAITADLHLTTRKKDPDRYLAMEDILHHCLASEVDALIVAGDLFDQTSPNYADFEALVREHGDPHLAIHIIPGNHDLGLTDDAFALEDVHVYTKPSVVKLDEDGETMLLLPYREEVTMGEEIAPFAGNLPAQRWLLIGHGDWTQGEKYPDPYEPGVYMPLTQTDLERYQPRKAFLGHIHRPTDSARVHYPGSPSPLDITETGLRRFLIYDTERGEISSHVVDSPLLYFQETFLVLPLEEETKYVRDQIADRIRSWNLPEGWEEKVRVRVNVTGYARSRSSVKDTVLESFADYQFYANQGPDLSELNQGDDPDRARIAQGVKAWLEDLDWPRGPYQPEKDQILAQALEVIYGA